MDRDKSVEKTVTITLTEACNLNCIYCYEHNKTPKKMTFEVAKKIVDKEMNMEDGTNFVIIEFFGGEPFMEFELIKAIHEYLLSRKWKKNFISTTSTNGTLVHGEIKDWLEKNKKTFNCGVSLDGTKEMHDYNRSNSFDLIDLDFFVKHWSHQTTKMTVSVESLKNLASGVIFLHKKGYKVACNLAYGIDWSREENCINLYRELNKLIEYYLENPDVEPCTMLSLNMQVISWEKKEIVRKWCGVGTSMHCYDCEGEQYPCQFFTPLAIGKDKAEDAKSIEIIEEFPVKNLDEKCRECPLIAACPNCMGSNYLENGNIYMKNDNYCKLVKIQLLANSYFKWQQIKKNQIQLSDSDLFYTLQGIKIVQEYLGNRI